MRTPSLAPLLGFFRNYLPSRYPTLSPAPRRGEGARGLEGKPAASAMAKELRQPRGGGGQVRPPPPRRSAARQRHDKHRRARPTEGGGQGQGRDPARRRGDPRQPTGNHARDRDQGGAGGQQTATAHTSRGDLRTRPHTDEAPSKRSGTGAAVPGAPAPVRRRRGGSRCGPVSSSTVSPKEEGLTAPPPVLRAFPCSSSPRATRTRHSGPPRTPPPPGSVLPGPSSPADLGTWSRV